MINNRQELANYCLRQLGGGVVEIEVTAEQLEDAVEKSIEYFTEVHYDGIERDYIAKQLTATTIEFDDTTGLIVGQQIVNTSTGSTANITDISGNVVTVDRIKGFKKFESGDIVSGRTATSVSLGDVDNGYVIVDDSIVGVLTVMNASTLYGAGYIAFDPKYQILAPEIQNITSSGGVSYFYSVMSYISHVNFVVNREKQFRFNRRWNKVYLDVNWGSDFKVGDTVMLEVYRMLDDNAYPKMLNDRWLKEYTAAQIKKTWGTNLKKYSGMSLPGGVQYNGQLIYDEAVREIEQLEVEATDKSAPLGFLVG
jgi:hypothetical protein